MKEKIIIIFHVAMFCSNFSYATDNKILTHRCDSYNIC